MRLGYVLYINLTKYKDRFKSENPTHAQLEQKETNNTQLHIFPDTKCRTLTYFTGQILILLMLKRLHC